MRIWSIFGREYKTRLEAMNRVADAVVQERRDGCTEDVKTIGREARHNHPISMSLRPSLLYPFLLLSFAHRQ